MSNLKQQINSIIKIILQNHQKWIAVQNRGTTLCYSIEKIKTRVIAEILIDIKTSLYPDDLLQFSNKLKIIVTILKDICDNIIESLKQLKALNELYELRLKKHNGDQKNDSKLLKTWTIKQLIHCIENIYNLYKNEYNIKILVMENISHARTKDELLVHTSIWEFPTYVNVDDVHILFASLQSECNIQMDTIKLSPQAKTERM